MDIQLADAITNKMICQDYHSISDIMTSYLYELLYCYICFNTKLYQSTTLSSQEVHTIKAWL